MAIFTFTGGKRKEKRECINKDNATLEFAKEPAKIYERDDQKEGRG